jgi:hypothetical protein
MRPRHRQRDEASGIYTKTRPWADRAIVLECPTAHRSRIAVRSLRLGAPWSACGGNSWAAHWHPPAGHVASCALCSPLCDNQKTILTQQRQGCERDADQHDQRLAPCCVRNHSHRAALRLAWFLCKEGKLDEGVERRNLNTCKADASESWKSSARHAPVVASRNARVARLLLPWPWAETCSIWAAASDVGSEDTSRHSRKQLHILHQVMSRGQPAPISPSDRHHETTDTTTVHSFQTICCAVHLQSPRSSLAHACCFVLFFPCASQPNRAV